jgi:hypothetical protein
MKRRDWLGAASVAMILGAMAMALVSPRPARGEGIAANVAFAKLCKTQSVLGLELSANATTLAGKPVQILGDMAPPLEPGLSFLVLTRAPAALCPFCNTDAD